MTNYSVIVIGKGIHLDRSFCTDPVIGFVVCRRYKASTPEDAQRLAKHHVLVEWNSQFNHDNKAGVPRLSIAYVEPIRSPFLRAKHFGGYSFFADDEGQERAVERLKPLATRWF